MEHLLNDIALCIVVAWVLAVLAKLLHQPLILAYLAAGVLLGPVGLGWIESSESINTIAELGLVFLLFMIGLEIDLKKILSAGRPILITALVQVFGGCALGVLFFWLVGFPLGGGKLDALYLGVAGALSSTVIVVKILYDKRELDTLGGRITLGLLIIQDLFIILFLAVQPSLKQPAFGVLALSMLQVVALVAITLITSRFVLPPLFRSVARLPELVLVGALAWCFLIAGLAIQLRLSREMGALVAGIALSTFPYALEVTAKVTTLRDFFLTLFFVALGMSIPKPDAALLGWAAVFCVFLVLSRFATVFFPLHKMRFGHRVSIIPMVNLSQVSEFSLVVLALGQKMGHIGSLTQASVSYAFVALAVVSSYALQRNDALFRWASPWLAKLGLPDLEKSAGPAEGSGKHPAKRIYFLGFFRTASSLLEEVQRRDPALLKEVAVVDFNPNVNQELKRRGIHVIYGDISQPQTLMHAGVENAEIIVCTIPDSILKATSNLRLVRHLRQLNPRARIICHAELLAEVSKLYEAGADYVCVPRLIEAAVLVDLLQGNAEDRFEYRRTQLEQIMSRRSEVIRD